MILFIILVLGVLLHVKYLNEFPSHIHAWAQADRYAIAQGFVNNHLNFFKPETFLHNYQFRDEWKTMSEESVTAVDFPIHDYMVGIVMTVIGSKSVWIFRVYVLLYSFLGLFYLFKLAFLISKNFAKSVFIVIFAASSPVFVFYQSGLLPTIPSLSNAIIGIYFYSSYLFHSKRNRYFILSIFFLTLATLSRTTFAIPLLAVWGMELLRILQKKAVFITKILPVTLSSFVIIVYHFYNNYLQTTYGTLFLNHVLPATSILEAFEIFHLVKERWLFQYFSKIHYLTFVLVLIIFLFFVLKSKTSQNKVVKQIFILLGIMSMGCMLFALLMLQQFKAHDYYFLDTFYLPLILLLLLSLSSIPISKNPGINAVMLTIMLLFGIPMVIKAFSSQKERRIVHRWDSTAKTVQNYYKSSEFLDSLNVPKDAKIILIETFAPNIPFLLMDRKGFALMSYRKEYIENALNQDCDYLVFQNESFITGLYTAYPDILKRIEKIGTNGKITLAQKSKIENQQTLYDFMDLQERKRLHKTVMTFDSSSVSEQWRNIHKTQISAISGANAGILDSTVEYGITYKTKHLPCLTEKSHTLYFNSWLRYESLKDCLLVVLVKENGEFSMYKTTNLKSLIHEKDIWTKIDLLYNLPKVNAADYELGVYLWNTGKSRLLLDDFSIAILD
uniref:hypothetical protein n=1 Tax=uncultured Draconibacterium sp. TaxID=1573823 RepID=UPI0032170FEB